MTPRGKPEAASTGARAPVLVDVSANSRERLLQVAIHLFARDGLDNVSLKAISDAAGNRNKSAVTYHFTGKQGLVGAVLQRLYDDLAPAIEGELDAFEAALARSETPDLGQVVLGLLTPPMLLYGDARYGKDAIKVLARLMHEPVSENHPAIFRAVQKLSDRTQRLFVRILPDKAPADIELCLQHALMATVNGLALQQNFLKRHFKAWRDRSLPDVFLAYVAYVASGIAGKPLTLSPAQEKAWRARFDPGAGNQTR